MALKILINGAKGRMGHAIAAAAEAAGLQWVGCDMGDNPGDFMKDCDAVIDFSFRDATAPLAKICAELKKPLVIGTTGHSPNSAPKSSNTRSKFPSFGRETTRSA